MAFQALRLSRTHGRILLFLLLASMIVHSSAIGLVPRTVVQVSTGDYTTCAIRSDATLVCWGYGYDGQLGVGDAATTPVVGNHRGEMGNNLDAVDFGTGRTVKKVIAGPTHNCAILDDGSVKCWGKGMNGRLGNGDTNDVGVSPEQMGNNLLAVDLGTGRTAVDIAIGYGHTCAVLDDGTVKCWGENNLGVLGVLTTLGHLGDSDDEMGNSLTAVELGSGSIVVNIAADWYHNCALFNTGEVKCWGSGISGQLGTGDTYSRGDHAGEMGSALHTVNLGTGRTAVQISAGKRYTCALLDDGSVKCWGENDLGQLGQNDKNATGDQLGEMGDDLLALDLGPHNAIMIATGMKHTCALLDDDSIICWGGNEYGQLGIGSATTEGVLLSEARAIGGVDLGTGRTAIYVAAGKLHTCAVLDNLRLKCWGENSYGSLGIESTENIGDAATELGDGMPYTKLGTRLPIPTAAPSPFPTSLPPTTASPTFAPTSAPSMSPTPLPTALPTKSPSASPTLPPSPLPTASPSVSTVALCSDDSEQRVFVLVEELAAYDLDCSTLSTEIGHFLQLTKLELPNADFAGTIPTQIGRLELLEELILNGNAFDGTLPIQLGRLKNLKALHLFDNELTGTVPTEIGFLKALTVLTLSLNQLEQDLPSELGELNRLKQLHVAQETPFTYIPHELEKLTRLQTLTLGEVCDCQAAKTINALATLGGSGQQAAATCNGQSTMDLSSNAVPCSPVRVADTARTTETTVEFSWTYSNRTEINTAESSFDFENFTGTYFRTAIDQFAATASSRLSAEQARNAISECSAVFLLDGSSNQKVWAFQLVLASGETVTETCVMVGDSTINRVMHTGFDKFTTLLDAMPGTRYELTIRPALVHFASGKLVDFGFGPRSNRISFVTADAVPSETVKNLRMTWREDDRVQLQWHEPEVTNGRIVQYWFQKIAYKTALSAITNETDGFPVFAEAPQVTLDLTDLSQDSKYLVSVIAETSKGRGPSAEFLFQTCPENMLASADSTMGCVAKRGFFFERQYNRSVSCTTLARQVDLTECYGEAVQVEDLKISSGFWRPSLLSTDIRPCPLGSVACSGGTNMSLCAPNYEGPMCAVCSEGYFSNGAECDRCEEPNLTSYAPLIAATVTVLVLIIGSGCVMKRYHNSLILAGSLALRLKILVSTYQIVGTFTWTLGTAFPRMYTEIVNLLLFMSFDVTDLFPAFDCLYRSDYLAELCMVTALPLAVIALILLYWKVARYCKTDEAKKSHIHTQCVQATILVTFFVYTPVASKIFRALRPCDEFQDIGKSYMPEDYSIVCGSAQHSVVVVTAYVMLSFYCVGTPIFYFILLWPKRKDIQRECELSCMDLTPELERELEKLQSKLKNVGFLYQSYWYWWWELVEVLRKVFLGGIVALVSPGTAEQSIVLMLLALVSTVLYHKFLPLRDENLLGLVACYTVFFAAFTSLLVKVQRGFLLSPLVDELMCLAVLSPIVVALILGGGNIRSLSSTCTFGTNGSKPRRVSRNTHGWLEMRSPDIFEEPRQESEQEKQVRFSSFKRYTRSATLNCKEVKPDESI